MRKTILPLTVLLFSLLIFNSCKKEEADVNMEMGYEFFPLEIGKYVVYDVDSLIWNPYLKATIPSKCQLRYDVADTFRDSDGNTGYVINVRYRKIETNSYRPHHVIYAIRHNNQLVVNENNLKLIKLKFPVKNGYSWDGNRLIPFKDKDNKPYENKKWDYVYSDFDQPFNAGIKLFLHSVTVNEIDAQAGNPEMDSTKYAYRNFSQEIYAYNVGMVYRERIYWEYQPETSDTTVTGTGYRNGYSVVMRAVEHN